ncbi:hypothetical protein SAMN05421788_105321 [Filimonas lacunae]|uniref:Uncharacterized protein n=1 Tax=Filimonas lacunae TaxID=477680 RepID=A0A173MCB6_9BACT|nr:hypothetical protein [Filimonas lacunae]BAV05223.1 hypothetical protein FLA_1230 [Filimonas lacunae]SIT22543.1 hypothetical protein SAMN05421788_105321 [Filimonas lacunae]
MRNFEDILADEQDDLNDEELLKYLEGQLDAAQQHNVEKKMADSAFLNDAMEGLASFPSKKQLKAQVKHLNKGLQNQLDTRKQRKEKRKIKDLPWILVAAVIILLLCVLGYTVLHLYHHHFTLKGR